ncbi:ubiquitin-conjugating enzyme E2 K-like [Styela clava]|uniref:ubiquitin-conjugating enzyme E2 K-like n=1 Tax=Styela clava TaxID=7725 RepID=UPI00193A5745|nr:ubiquitin-conjugating enzyme E2 K-like [Styela clava]
MSSIAVMRIKRELKDAEDEKDLFITITCESKLTELRGQIKGPPGTPYAGGTYDLDIKIPDTYPFNPPKIKFLTQIWHPNISSVTGAICLDILKDQWAAALTLRTVLLSLQALLQAAEPDDPQDAVVAKQFKDNRHIFNKTALYWAQHFAKAPGKKEESFEKQIRTITEMGFFQSDALQALSAHNWNMESAIQYLTS